MIAHLLDQVFAELDEGSLDPETAQDARAYLTLFAARIGLRPPLEEPPSTSAADTWQDWVSSAWPDANDKHRRLLWSMWGRALLVARVRLLESGKRASAGSGPPSEIDTEDDLDLALLGYARKETPISESLMSVLQLRGLMASALDDPRGCLTPRATALLEGSR